MMMFLSSAIRAPLARLTPIIGLRGFPKRTVGSYVVAMATSLDSNAAGNIVMMSRYAAVLCTIGGLPQTVDGQPGSQRIGTTVKLSTQHPTPTYVVCVVTTGTAITRRHMCVTASQSVAWDRWRAIGSNITPLRPHKWSCCHGGLRLNMKPVQPESGRTR